MAFGEWWRKQPRWKWFGLVVALWIVIGISINTVTKHSASSDSGHVTIAISPAMTSRDYTFWQRLNPQQKVGLASDCRAQLVSDTKQPGAAGGDSYGDTRAQIVAFTPTRLATGVTSLYTDPTNTIFNVKDACEEVINAVAQQQDNNQTAQSVAQTERNIHKRQQVLNSVKTHTFTAANGFVRAYMKADSVGYAIRSVDCANRTTCTIAYDDVDPENHPILSAILGSGVNDPEVQLIRPMTELFRALFSDPKLQQASLTSWIDQQTVGGKVVLWPALRISCDRAANAQIDWGNVTPDGLRHLCSYSLLPDGSLH
jgi:hypothetical protein